MVSGQKIIAAVGNFDGVHLGHQYLLKQTAEFAREQNAAPGVVVFEPHPRRYFRPDDPPFLLTLPTQRDALLRAAGVADIYTIAFNKALASMSPKEFVVDVLKGQFGLAGVIVGIDFRFGAQRAGDSATLARLGGDAGLVVKLIDVLAENPNTEKYGSSLVREALRDGAIDRATMMLGRPWSVLGAVGEGRKVGRTLGFPTANMTLGELIVPRQGVYATRVRVDGKSYGAVSNYGRRPTFGDDAPLLETFLFDFDGDLYGREIAVDFIAFLRDEVKFDGLDALKAQIAEDCRQARALLG